MVKDFKYYADNACLSGSSGRRPTDYATWKGKGPRL